MLLVLLGAILWARLLISCWIPGSLYLLHLTLKGLIASHNPWQLVKPAHTEQSFMHGLFMFKNVFSLSFLMSDIVCIFFTFQGYSVGVLSHPPRDLWHEKAKNLSLDSVHSDFLVAWKANGPQVSHKSIVPGCSSPRRWESSILLVLISHLPSRSHHTSGCTHHHNVLSDCEEHLDEQVARKLQEVQQNREEECAKWFEKWQKYALKQKHK